EVAFSAYARIQDDGQAVAQGFLKSVRVVMLLAVPFCLGLAVVAAPAVEVMLGAKWIGSVPLIQLLALAMPFMTLQVMFAPATNAMGQPGISTRSSILGAIVMPAAFLVGIMLAGLPGVAWAWLLGYPLLTAITAAWSLPTIGITTRQLISAIGAPVLAGLAMAASVLVVDRALPGLHVAARLAVLVAAGGAIYGGWLLTFARDRIDEVLGLVLKR
ncbi:MAG: oligosaccharide flippase family protein, partial [Sphingomonadaceae bacterium]|nr:oligosaccharide flippase family protein [Sphingomonadaceae bacterium]